MSLHRFTQVMRKVAAKEACAKALGTGFRDGVFWRDMEVVNLASGKPTLILSGGALRQLASLTPKGMKTIIHLTLTDEYPLAQAQVVIEALPAE
jgi:holo-[acyl-carrier protein] synthase